MAKNCCGCFGRKHSKRGDANLDSSDDEAYGFPSFKRTSRHSDVIAPPVIETYTERKDTSLSCYSEPPRRADTTAAAVNETADTAQQ